MIVIAVKINIYILLAHRYRVGKIRGKNWPRERKDLSFKVVFIKKIISLYNDLHFLLVLLKLSCFHYMLKNNFLLNKFFLKKQPKVLSAWIPDFVKMNYCLEILTYFLKVFKEGVIHF